MATEKNGSGVIVSVFNLIGAKHRRRFAWATTAALAMVAGQHANASTLTWDPLNTTTGSDGSGSWNNGSGSNFASGGIDTFWSNGNAAVFGAGGTGTDTVTLGTPLVVSSLTVNAGATYNFTGAAADTFNIGGGTINYSTTVTLTSFNLAGSGGLTFNGSPGSVLTLAGSGQSQDSLTGAITVAGGTLNVAYTGLTGLGTGFSASQTFNVSAGATLIESAASSLGSAYALPIVNVNGGIFTMNGSSYGPNVVLTGGTFNSGNSSTYNAYYGASGSQPSGITTLASSTTSLIAVNFASGYEAAPMNISAGSTASGFDAIYSGVMTGSYGMNKSGAGVLEVTGISTDTGTAYVTDGTITVSSGATLGAATSPLAINSSGSNPSPATTVNYVGSASIGSLTGTLTGTGAASTLNVGGNLTDLQTSATTFAGNLNVSGGLTVSGNGTLTLSGTDTVGSLVLTNGASVSATNSFTSGGALTLGGSKLTLGTTGTPIAGFNFSSTTLTAGASIINAYVSSNLGLGTISRSPYSTLDITLPTSGATVTTTTPDTNPSILGGWATLNSGASFAVSTGTSGSPGAITGLTSSASTYSNNYTGTTSATDFNANASGTFAIASSFTTAPGTFTGFAVNTLQFNTASAVTATLPGPVVITSGGILVSPAVGANTSTITGGTLTSAAAGELFIDQYNTTGLTINSTIVNNGSTPLALVKAGTGTVKLGVANTYTGNTYVQAGGVALGNTGGLGTGSLNVGFNANPATADSSTNGAFLDLTGLTTLSNLNQGGTLMPVALNVTPNNIVMPATTTTTYYTIVIPSGTADAQTLSGTISGGSSTTNIELNTSTSGDASGTFILTGTNTYVGGWYLNRGSLAIASDASLGPDSDPLTVATNPGTTETFLNSMTFGHAVSDVQTSYFDTQGNSVTMTGVISGTGSITKLGTGTLTLSATDTVTGSLTLTNGTVAFSTAGTIASTALIFNGGTLSTPSAHSVGLTLNTSNVSAGESNLSVNNLSTSTLNISLGAISHYIGSTLNFSTLPTTGKVTTNTANGATTILGGWATAGGNSWAVSAGTGTALGAVTALSTFGTSYSSTTAATNFDATTSGTLTTGVNTLRFNTASATTVTLPTGFSVTSGGILASAAVGANTPTITGGTLTAPAGQDLIISQFDTATPLVIASTIVDTANVLTPTVTTMASTSITLTSTAGMYPGEHVSGANIPSGAVITSVASGTSIVISSAATAGTGTLTFTGGTSLTLSGTGVTQLTGTNTYTGTTFLDGGTLSVSADSNFGTAPANASASSIVLNGGTLMPSASFTLGATRGIAIGANGANVDAPSGVTLTIAGIIGSTATNTGPLTKIDTGTLNLSGASTYTGGTIVNAGTLNLTGSMHGPITINNGGTFTAAGFTELGQSAQVPTVTVNTGGTFTTLGGQPASYSTNFFLNGGTVSGTYGLAFAPGYGITTLPSSTTATISSTLYGYGTVPLFLNVSSGSTSTGTDLLISGTITQYSGTTSLVKNGAGTVVYSAATAAPSFDGTNYNGSTTINAGTFIVTGGGSAGGRMPGTPTITVNSGATFGLNGSSADVIGYTAGKEALVINDGTVSNTGQRQTIENTITMTGGLLASSGSGSYEGNAATLFTATSDGAGLPATVTGTVAMNLSSNAFNVSQGVAAPAVDMLVSSGLANYGSATAGVVKNGTGILEFTGSNSYTGGTTVNGGTLLIGGSTTDPSVTVTAGTYTVLSGATISSSTNLSNAGIVNFNNSASTVATLNGAGNLNLNGTALTVSGGGTYSGPIAGTGSLAVTGGSLTLSASSTYSGGTTVSAGTLVVSNSLGSATGTGNVTLNGGTLASGTVGSISGTVLAGTGAHVIAPGGLGSIGTLNVGGLTTSSLTTITFDLGSGSGPIITNGDLLVLGTAGTTIGAGTNIAFGTNPTTTGLDYRLIGDTNSGTTVGSIPLTSFTLPTAPTGETYTLSTTVDPGYIDLVVGTSGPANLTWDNSGGTGNGTTWDIATNQNWNNGTAAVVYHEGDIVTFNDNNNGQFAVSLNTVVQPKSVTVATANAYTISGTGGIADVASGMTPLTLTGTGSLTLGGSNTYTGGTTVGTGSDTPKLILTGSNSLPVGSALTINAGATVQIAAHSGGSANIVVATAGSVTNNGLIDVTNNDLIIRGATLGTITTEIASGYAGGTWNGTTGITSSTAAANPLTAVGVLLNDNLGTAIYSTFDGASTVDGDVLVKYTYYGDANLDGAVDGSDYTLIDAGFNSGGTLTGWQNGDFNYDGKVDGSDYTLIDNAFNTQGSTLGSNPAALIASSTAQFGGGSAVPEPTTLGLVGVGAAGLLTRRRRR